MHKAWKYAGIAAMGGALLQFGGCINSLWTALPVYLGTELLIDSNIVFDLFTDP